MVLVLVVMVDLLEATMVAEMVETIHQVQVVEQLILL